MSIFGLYRHFKGGYYLLLNVMRGESASGNTAMYQYLDVMHPQAGYFCRPAVEWDEDVSLREDNVTGQKKRFEKVVSLENGLANFSTEQIIAELTSREDSPLQSADVERFNSLVFFTDYCVGEKVRDKETEEEGVFTLYACDRKEDAFKYLNRQGNNRCEVFKRVFVSETQGL